MSVVASLPLPVPPWDEQLVLVRRIDDFLQRQVQLIQLAAVQEQLDLTEAAILSRAFRGKLKVRSRAQP